MKQFKNVFLTFCIAVAAITAVAYVSCNKNYCAGVTCKNNGICDGGTCYCPVGYEGIRCEVLSRDKFVFTYNGHDSCSANGQGQYPIHLLATPGDSLELTMRNFLNDPDDSAVCVIRSVDSFSFMGNNNGTSYTGTGKLSNDSLWLSYSVVADTVSYSCKYLGGSLR